MHCSILYLTNGQKGELEVEYNDPNDLITTHDFKPCKV